ncbi:hypothetical protein JJB09_20335 [Rhizobium sp. KVB221]|uniref:Uncharacterized protein n=1 Tax=Rhizobium setariae TaxID=2801340 RepID=A0A936YVS2_9HYPH|nr:hypothetical protein [Rhizobium setariae]MBL0374367.1 hypothetical protein [Rhizobium setariae]
MPIALPNPKGSIIHSRPPLLTGRLFDEQGNRLTPVHTQNHGKRYRYHVTDTRKADTYDADVWRIPGSVIEPIVEAQLIQVLRNRAQLAKWIQKYCPTSNLARSLENAAALESRLLADNLSESKASIIRRIFMRISLATNSIHFEIDVRRLVAIIAKHGRGIDIPAVNQSAESGGRQHGKPAMNLQPPRSRSPCPSFSSAEVRKYGSWLRMAQRKTNR